MADARLTSKEAETLALLVMDVQQGIVERFGDEDGGLLERLGSALEAARAAGVMVIYVRLAFRSGYPEISSANRSFAALSESGGFTDDDPATQIHPAIAPRPGETVVVKKRVSAFSGSDLELVLRAKHVTSLVLTGISTSGVVLSTLREAADRDYRLLVLTDGCADRDPEVHRVLIEKVFPRQAEIASVAEWTARIAR